MWRRVQAVGALAAIVGAIVTGAVVYHEHLRNDLSPTDILRRSLEANRDISYDGEQKVTTIIRGKPVVARIRVSHAYPNRHRITVLSGPGKNSVTACDGTINWHWTPSSPNIVVTGRTIPDKEEDNRLGLLLRNHIVTLIGETTVAGQPVYHLRITPRFPGNPSRDLWIDKQHFVTLRNREYGYDHNLLSETDFLSIKYNVTFPAFHFVLPNHQTVVMASQHQEAAKRVTLRQLGKAVGFSPGLPGYLPAGYELDGYYQYDCRCCVRPTAMMRYINGLNSISLFETELRRHVHATNDQKSNTLQCLLVDFGHDSAVSVTDHDPLIMVVGDLAKEELYKIATSVR